MEKDNLHDRRSVDLCKEKRMMRVTNNDVTRMKGKSNARAQ